jgi:hypothetical protein
MHYSTSSCPISTPWLSLHAPSRSPWTGASYHPPIPLHLTFLPSTYATGPSYLCLALATKYTSETSNTAT